MECSQVMNKSMRKFQEIKKEERRKLLFEKKKKKKKNFTLEQMGSPMNAVKNDRPAMTILVC